MEIVTNGFPAVRAVLLGKVVAGHTDFVGAAVKADGYGGLLRERIYF